MIKLLFTEEEMCCQLMEELEPLTDEEWAMLESMKGKEQTP
jgi:hypothetical protein